MALQNALGVSPLVASLGGTGTATTFTQNSIVFAGVSGVYSQNNSNFAWNNSTTTFTLNGISNIGGTISVSGGVGYSVSGSALFSVANSSTYVANFDLAPNITIASGKTLTNLYNLYLEAGSVQPGSLGTITTWTNLSVAEPTGGSTNLAASFLGAINIGTTAQSSFSRLGVLNLGTPLAVGSGGTGAATFTAKGLLYGNTTAAIGVTGALSDGQIVIGSTAGNPAAASLTAGTNIAITAGSNSITISANTTSQVVAYTAVANAASPYTVLSTDYYIGANVTAGTVTLRLPNAPTTGRIFVIKDSVGLAATNNITITTVGGVVNIDGATSYTLNTVYASVQLIFNGTSYEVY